MNSVINPKRTNLGFCHESCETTSLGFVDTNRRPEDQARSVPRSPSESVGIVSIQDKKEVRLSHQKQVEDRKSTQKCGLCLYTTVQDTDKSTFKIESLSLF